MINSRLPFNGIINLDVVFQDKVMWTPIYIKIDACDRLLLSEGVCQQLGILWCASRYL